MTTAYRSPQAPTPHTRDQAVAAARRWARWTGISGAAFARCIERVEPIGAPPLTASGSSDRDSLTGMPVVAPDPIAAAHDPAGEAPAPVTPDPHHRIYYRLATGAASIDIRGHAQGANVTGDAGPIRTRAVLVALFFALALAGTWFVRASSIGRHAWFAHHGAGTEIAVGGAICALALSVGFAEWLLGRAARRTPVLIVSLLVALGSAGAAMRVERIKRPSPSHAYVEMLAGHPADALAEAEAVDALRADEPSAPSAVDELNLRALPVDANVDLLVHAMRQPWRRPAARAQVLARLQSTARAEAMRLINAGGRGEDLEQLGDLVLEWMPTERLQWYGRAAMMDARADCFEPEPDALCFERNALRARDGGVPEEEIAALQHELGRHAREWLAARVERIATSTEMDPSMRDFSVEQTIQMADSILVHLHEDPGIDAIALRQRFRARE